MRYTLRRLEESPWEQVRRWCKDELPDSIWGALFVAALIVYVVLIYGEIGTGF
jgi:hypothetical protein